MSSEDCSLLVGIKEAAKLLNCSTSLLYQHEERGIPVVSVGTHIKFPRAFIEAVARGEKKILPRRSTKKSPKKKDS